MGVRFAPVGALVASEWGRATAIGYANVAPLGVGSRLLVGSESFIGAALMALLVAVLARRITR